jgi:hypothetical protein
MSVIPEDYGESATQFRATGTSTYGVVVLGHSFGIGVPSPVDGANAIHDSWQAMDIMAILSSAWQLESVKLTIMTASGPVSGFDTRSPLTGTNGAGAAAPNVALLVRKSTDQGGRAGRGRMYIPGMDELDVGVDGIITPAMVTLSGTVFGDMINDFSTNDVPLRLLHSSGGPAPAVVTGLSVDTTVATQRRRLRR